ncbi:MAG: ribulose-phosphate 3-epimerase [Eubacteriales Family XIII. Incertae Sedis bacterium]|nr:MAG: ribulose-phosphate 3-epimerase [Clostridiales Family XIII bacterium]
MKRLAPSILSADFSRLGEQIASIERAGAHLIHVDVMDGHFVPNISFGSAVMKSLLGKTELPFDVHLMIENPDKYAGDFVTPNTEFITVHQEACTHLHRSIQNIKSLGVKAGVALNPATHLGTLDYVIDDVDMILVMSVNPGFGGQKFIPKTLEKVRELAEIRAEEGLDFEIEIDGGITLDNVKEVTDAGVSVVVAGSSVFGASDIEARVREFVKW